MAEPHSDEGDEDDEEAGEEGCDDEGSVQVPLVGTPVNKRATLPQPRTARRLSRFALYRNKVGASTRSSKLSAIARS